MLLGAGVLSLVVFYLLKGAVYLAIIFVIKLLWKAKDSGIKKIKYAMILFFIAEAFCGIQVYIYRHVVTWAELAHSFLSVPFSALLIFGMMEIFNTKVCHFSDASNPCLLRKFCIGCSKRHGQDCLFLPFILWMILLLALTASIPFFATDREPRFYPEDYTLPFPILNDYFDRHFSPTLKSWGIIKDSYPVQQEMSIVRVFERWIYPAIAIISFVAGFFVLYFTRNQIWAMYPVSLGMGAAFYAFFKLILYTAIDKALWACFWEETTELATALLVYFSFKYFSNQFGITEGIKRRMG